MSDTSKMNLSGTSINTRSQLIGSKFGVGLAKARIAAGFTQSEVAKIIGRKQTSISTWEVGNSEPSIDVICQLLELYSVSFEDVVGGAPHPVTITADEMRLVQSFRNLSKQNQEAVEAVMAVYSKYQ